MIIKSDKVLHFVACFVIAAFVALLSFGVFDLGKVPSILLGLVTSLATGVGKEVFDYYVRKTGFDKSDLLADVLGAVLASLFAFGM